MKVYITDTKEHMDCKIIKENNKTIWIELPNKDIVKRHRIKHNIKGILTINQIEVKNETTSIDNS